MRFKRRKYQTRCVDALKAALRAEQKRALIDMATGLGKTVTVGRFVKWFLKRKLGRVLFLCHQNDLVEQLEKKVKEVVGDGYSYGILHGKKKARGRVDILFASLQTMRNWKERYGEDAFSLVVVDEAHHSSAETFGETILYFESLLTVGMTATASPAIRRIYGRPIFRLPLERALAAGLLTPVRYSVYLDSTKRLDEVVEGRPARKLSVRELNARLFDERTEDEVARIVAERMREVPNAQAMVFASDVAQCDRFSEALARYVSDVSTVHYEVDSDERTERLEHFREGKLRALTARDVLNEGIDVPAVTHVVFLRATDSMRIFLQQLGRALRRHEGKEEVYVLDFVGNCERLVLVSELAERINAAVAKRARPGATQREPFVLEERDAELAPEFAHRVRDLLEILQVIRTAWTEQSGFQAIRDLYGRLNRPIRGADIEQASLAGECPSIRWLLKYDPEGRSHIPGLKRAGVPVRNERVRKTWTEAEVLDSLRALHSELGRPLKSADLLAAAKRGEIPHTKWLVTRFDPHRRSYFPALERAGVPAAKKKYRKWTIELALEGLRLLHRRLGRPLTGSDVSRGSKERICPSPDWLKRNFDPDRRSHIPALERAGVPVEGERREAWTKSSAQAALMELQRRLGRPLTPEDIRGRSKENQCPSEWWIVRHFDPVNGSLSAALAAAGVPAVKMKVRRRWTDESALDALRGLSAELGRIPTVIQVAAAATEGRCPSVVYFYSHFGEGRKSLEPAFKKAGLL